MLTRKIKTKMKTKNREKIISIFLTIIFSSINLSEAFSQSKEGSDVDEGISQETIKDQEFGKVTVDKADPSRFNTIAVIQGLNKITAKTSILEAKVGDTIRFGKITITIHKCWQAALDQKPESKILLEVHDNDQSSKNRIFYGWMFSSSPSISALEHPIYDITAVSCKNR